ncbi:MAG: 2-iminoacetate synthase ThiH [Planctomycetota bacterium]|jgi:2-iminoacetate synthase
MISQKGHSKAVTSKLFTKTGLDSKEEFWKKRLDSVTSNDVEQALASPAGSYSLNKMLALVSPAAEAYLEEMAQIAHQLTVQRFGRTIKLYAPLYLSNYCINGCKYCGFNKDNTSNRRRLTIEEAVAESELIASEGFRDILLVSGEDREFISIDYLTQLTQKLRDTFSSISIEVYQLNTAEYNRLFKAGIEGVTLYQETYNRRIYDYYHPIGPKSDYDNRLNGPDRIAASGMREIGIGVLLGLFDWRIESLALAENAHYLMKRYWQSHVSISFPRLRPASQVEQSQFEYLVRDKELVQMITALRLCFADVGLVLSTRERAVLRDHLVKIGITKMSAGSKTSPGGYSKRRSSTEQFEIDDTRSSDEVARMIRGHGFDPVWKDWDTAFVKEFKKK